MQDKSYLTPALMDGKTASRFCGVGLTLWRQITATGGNPEPIRLHSRVLWPTRLLEAWALHGCPARDTEKWRQILNKIGEQI